MVRVVVVVVPATAVVAKVVFVAAFLVATAVAVGGEGGVGTAEEVEEK